MAIKKYYPKRLPFYKGVFSWKQEIDDAKDMHTTITKNLVSFLISVIFMGAVLSVLSRCYGANDNIAILWDIKSDCMVSFMSVSLGKILSFCYLNISGIIPWYGLTLYAFLGVTLYLVIFSVWKLERLGYLLIPFLTMFLALSLRHVTHIDYSTVSILLASGSLLGLLVYLEKADKKCLLPVIILGICFSFSYHIRMDGIKAALCFAAPALLLGVFRVRKSYWYLLLFIMPIAITIPVDRFYGKSLETESDIRFNEWNSLRGQFNDFPIQWLNRDNKKIRNVNHWSQNDYALLTRWLYLDENKFNIATLRNVFDYAYAPPTALSKLPLIKGCFIELAKTYRIHLCVLMFIALLGFITLGTHGRIMPIIYMGYILGVAIGMQLFFRFPGRIGKPILLGCIIWMTYMVFNITRIRSELNNSGKKLTIFASLLFMLFACVTIYDFKNIVRRDSLGQKNHYKSVKELEEMNAKFFLIQPAMGGLNYELSDPLKNTNYNFKAIHGGWPTFSPCFYKDLREIGMEHAYEIFPRLARDEGCYVVVNEECITLISTYLWETYGLQNKFILVKQLSNHLTVFKIVAL